MKSIHIILALFFVGGCTLGPDYVRPATPLAPTYPEATSGRTSISVEWWKSFRDSQLDDWVMRALKANSDLAMAVARVEQAEALFKEVDGASYPPVNGVASAQRVQLSEDGFNPNLALNGRTRSNQRVALATAFEIDFWGRLSRAKEGARAQLLAATEARRVVELAVGSAVVRAYVLLRAADTQIQATEEIIAVRRAEIDLLSQKAKLGAVNPSELAVGNVALEEATLRATELRRIRAASEHLLGQLIARPNLVVLPSRNRHLTVPAPAAAGLPADLLKTRPDILAAEQALIVANAQIGFTMASRFPTFSLTGSLGTESRELGDLFKSGNTASSLGLGMELPVLDYGQGQARVEAALANRKLAAAGYEQTILNAFREVRDALGDVRETNLASKAADRMSAASKEALRIARARQGIGQDGPEGLLFARRAWAEARIVVARARANQILANVDLIRTLGGARPDVEVKH